MPTPNQSVVSITDRMDLVKYNALDAWHPLRVRRRQQHYLKLKFTVSRYERSELV